MENSNVFESIKYSYKIAELDEKANSCSEENPIWEFSVKIEFHNINKSILDIGITSFVSPLHLACHNDPINKPLFEFKAKYYVNTPHELNKECIKNILTEITYQHLLRNTEYLKNKYGISYDDMNVPSISSLFSYIDIENLDDKLIKIPIYPFYQSEYEKRV